MNIPAAVKEILGRLANSAHRADVVGGAVRDALLGKEPSDFDITTSALPEEIKEVFKNEKTVDIGIRHGTVAVILSGKQYEITTYRIDGEYRDNRHPVSVSFSKNIKDDLSRRDFTVNAMAYSEEYGLTDEFCGREDLEHRIIRAVGEPELRFSEDALRILRAIRFASTLDFEIEPKTAAALEEKKSGLADVSGQRIAVEWKKLLAGVGSYRILSEYKSIISAVLPQLSEMKLPKLSVWQEATVPERELMLFYLNSDTEGFRSAKARLKSDSASLKFGTAVLDIMKKLPIKCSTGLYRLLVDCEDEPLVCALRIGAALGVSSYADFELCQAKIASGHPRKVGMLAVSGTDVLALGIRGEAVGRILSELLWRVTVGQCENSREALVAEIKRIKL